MFHDTEINITVDGKTWMIDSKLGKLVLEETMAREYIKSRHLIEDFELNLGLTIYSHKSNTHDPRTTLHFNRLGRFISLV